MQNTHLTPKEQKQLQRLRRQRTGQLSGFAMGITLLIIVLINCIDELSSTMGGSFQSNVVNDFFVARGNSYEAGLSAITVVGTVTGAFAILSPFYRSLSDRWGRKLFLVLNTLGMGLGMMICGMAPNYLWYAIGSGLITFFIVHDTQIIFILEVAPANNRAVFYSLTKAAGILAGLTLPLLRTLIMGNDPSKWQGVYIVPAMLAMGIGLVTWLLAKESQPFINSRIAYLEQTPEQRNQQKLAGNEEKIGVFPAIRYLLTHKAFRWNTVSRMVLGLAQVALTSYYQSIMSSEAYGTLSTAQITDVLFICPLVYACTTLLSGYVADKLGRKALEVIYGAVCGVCFCLFVAGAGAGWNPTLIGILYGLYVGTYWGCVDYLGIILAEMAPSSIRSSLVGASSLLIYLAVGLGTVLAMAAFLLLELGIACLVVGIPCVAASVLLTVFTGTETKSISMENHTH